MSSSVTKEAEKRASMDHTDTTMTPDASETGSHGELRPSDSADRMFVDWPEESSFQDTILPAVLLIENDPFVQQELLLDAPSEHESGEDDLEEMNDLMAKRRARLAASMQRSRRSRKCLEDHIQQRANLASVLADINESSERVGAHLLRGETNLLPGIDPDKYMNDEPSMHD